MTKQYDEFTPLTPSEAIRMMELGRDLVALTTDGYRVKVQRISVCERAYTDGSKGAPIVKVYTRHDETAFQPSAIFLTFA